VCILCINSVMMNKEESWQAGGMQKRSGEGGEEGGRKAHRKGSGRTGEGDWRAEGVWDGQGEGGGKRERGAERVRETGGPLVREIINVTCHTFHPAHLDQVPSQQVRCVLAQMRGNVEQDGEVMEGVTIFGTWHEGLYATMPDGSQRTMWKNKPLPADPSR
jgi:hypothetical protein